MNNQLKEKQIQSDGQTLDVHSIFYTIQGEGPFAGRPAIFIRLAGCNLQCPGCDTEYTDGREQLHVMSIASKVFDLTPAEMLSDLDELLVVITGGEPFRQNISPLCLELITRRYTVQIETNGVLPPSHGLHREVVVVCSPKTPNIHPRMVERIDHLKYVATSTGIAEDGLPDYALNHFVSPSPLARPVAHFEGNIYLQPMDEKDDELNLLNQQAVVASCLEHGYTLQLQIHKIIGVA